jgi:hypothetical protein
MAERGLSLSTMLFAASESILPLIYSLGETPVTAENNLAKWRTE